MPPKDSKEFEIYSAETGEKIERDCLDNFVDYYDDFENTLLILNNGIKGAIRLTVSIKGKELYDMCRMADGKPPLKKGNNRWRTIRRLERKK